MALTAEKEAELVAQGATPEVLKYIKANHEVLDRHDARAAGAEGETAKERAARVAAEKVVQDLKDKDKSELDKAKDDAAKERTAREKAEADAKREKGAAIVTKAALRAGAIDEADVMKLLDHAVIERGEAAVTEAVSALKVKYPALFGDADRKYKDGEDHPRGGGGKGKGAEDKEMTQAEWNRKTPAEKQAFSLKGGRIVG